jgi:hypothetical protein
LEAEEEHPDQPWGKEEGKEALVFRVQTWEEEVHHDRTLVVLILEALGA